MCPHAWVEVNGQHVGVNFLLLPVLGTELRLSGLEAMGHVISPVHVLRPSVLYPRRVSIPLHNQGGWPWSPDPAASTFRVPRILRVCTAPAFIPSRGGTPGFMCTRLTVYKLSPIAHSIHEILKNSFDCLLPFGCLKSLRSCGDSRLGLGET